jgi:hypothetical protein
MKDIRHMNTGEVVSVEIVATRGTWLIAKDGYTYDMRYWRQVDGQKST